MLKAKPLSVKCKNDSSRLLNIHTPSPDLTNNTKGLHSIEEVTGLLTTTCLGYFREISLKQRFLNLNMHKNPLEEHKVLIQQFEVGAPKSEFLTSSQLLLLRLLLGWGPHLKIPCPRRSSYCCFEKHQSLLRLGESSPLIHQTWFQMSVATSKLLKEKAFTSMCISSENSLQREVPKLPWASSEERPWRPVLPCTSPTRLA